MLEIKQYICEKCKTVYDRPKDAHECEASHIKVENLRIVHVGNIYDDRLNAPVIIYIKSNNSNTIYEYGLIEHSNFNPEDNKDTLDDDSEYAK